MKDKNEVTYEDLFKLPYGEITTLNGDIINVYIQGNCKNIKITTNKYIITISNLPPMNGVYIIAYDLITKQNKYFEKYLDWVVNEITYDKSYNEIIVAIYNALLDLI